MEILKLLLIGILKYIGTAIFATVIVMITLFSYFPLQEYIFGKGDYLLFVSSEINIIPAIMIMVLLVYFSLEFCCKFTNKNIENDEWIDDGLSDNDDAEEDIESISFKEQILFKLLTKFVDCMDFLYALFCKVKIYYIPVLLIAIYVGMTSYTVLYADSIKTSSPLKPFGGNYDYSEIEKINVGLNKGNDDSYSPFYEIILNDGTTVDFMKGGKSNTDTEGVLFNFDKELRSRGIPKSVNKDNFEKFAEELGDDYVKAIKKLFIK